MSVWDHPEIRDSSDSRCEEDIGTGDVTTHACVPADRHGDAAVSSPARRQSSPASSCCRSSTTHAAASTS